MEKEELISLVQKIVGDAVKLKDDHTDQKGIAVGYACVFAHNDSEFESLRAAAEKIGKILKSTVTGPIFQIQPISTAAGRLRVLKIRLPDLTRKERGDADFNLPDYETFKKANLNKPGFKFIPRDNFEMIELMEDGANVRVYFSNPPMEKQLGLVA
jgi:hypothetical protein